MLETLPVVSVKYPQKRSVLASYRVTGTSLSLFVPTAQTEVGLGGDVCLVVTFGDCDRTFSFRGQVTWRRAEARSATMEPGLGVSFRGAEKFVAAQMLAFCAGKPLDLGTAADERFPTNLDCKVHIGSRELNAQVRDLSVTGAFIASPKLATARVGTPFTVVLHPGWFGLGRQAYEAKVVWSGDQKGLPGCGARFLDEAGSSRRGLKRYLVPRRGTRRTAR